jgi:hypothetical protein
MLLGVLHNEQKVVRSSEITKAVVIRLGQETGGELYG